MKNIFFIGDIVGRPGRNIVKELLGEIIREKRIDFVIANAENSAGGKGITPKVMEELLCCGIDVLTSGNHIWKRNEYKEVINKEQLLRPANYPDIAPGKGYNIYKIKNTKIAVINLQGRVFMDPIDCPFSVVDEILKALKAVQIIIVDMHAEATSEKLALAWYLDGKVSAVIGTHTHIQTADARIFPQGTAYITDAGMTGSMNGILGVEKAEIIKKFLSCMPFKFKIAKGEESIHGVIIKVDEKTGKSCEIRNLQI